jgi:hypothetical protein
VRARVSACALVLECIVENKTYRSGAKDDFALEAVILRGGGGGEQISIFDSIYNC